MADVPTTPTLGQQATLQMSAGIHNNPYSRIPQLPPTPCASVHSPWLSPHTFPDSYSPGHQMSASPAMYYSSPAGYLSPPQLPVSYAGYSPYSSPHMAPSPWISFPHAMKGHQTSLPMSLHILPKS